MCGCRCGCQKHCNSQTKPTQCTPEQVSKCHGDGKKGETSSK